MTCSVCGSEVGSEAVTCGGCGASPRQRDLFEATRRSGEAVLAGDVEALDRFLAPELVIHDHRQLGLGPDISRRRFLEFIAVRPATVGTAHASVLDRRFLGDDVIAFLVEIRSTSPEHAGESVMEHWAINVWDEHVRCVRHELYDPHDRDRALASAHELADGAA